MALDVRSKSLILLGAIALCFAVPARAADTQPLEKLAGSTLKVSQFGDVTYLDIVAREADIEDNAVDIYPLLGHDLAAAAFGAGDTRRAFYVGEALAADALALAYTYAGADKVHVIVQLVTADKFGRDHFEKMFSFDFDKALADRINWRQFNPRNFYRVAKDFVTPADVKARMYTEEFSYDPPPSGD